MITEELIDELEQRFNGFNRTGDHGLLRFLNSAHEILMTVEAEQTLLLDTATGGLPAINTVAGTFLYIMPTEVHRVSKVLVKSGNPLSPVIDYGIRQYQAKSITNSISVGGQFYAKIPYIKTRDRLNDNQLASVMFTQDPTTQNDVYFRQSYRRPVQILSESIQHEVPAPFDYDFLLPAAAKLIEGQCNGNYDEARRIVRMELKPAMWKELDSGDQGDLDMEPVDRGF
jgi:hypothetical protein